MMCAYTTPQNSPHLPPKKNTPVPKPIPVVCFFSEQRKALPIHQLRQQLMNAVQEYQILVIIGETGSGVWVCVSLPYKEEPYYLMFFVVFFLAYRRFDIFSRILKQRTFITIHNSFIHNCLFPGNK